MKRAKIKKKRKAAEPADIRQIAYKVINKERAKMQEENLDKILNYILPVISAAYKGELRLSNEQLNKANKGFERYMDWLDEGVISLEDIKRVLED